MSKEVWSVGRDKRYKEEIEVKPPWIRWLCAHNYTGGVRTVFDNKGSKRHARICVKCGKREYID